MDRKLDPDVDRTVERFRNAPIVEALLDIRAELPSTIDLDRLATIHQAVRNQYPIKRERGSWKFGFHVRQGIPEDPEKPVGDVDGFLFLSADERKTVQVRLDGFTFNWLRPYDRWESFRDEAMRVWSLYIQATEPRRITRTALRYINRIEIPVPLRDLKDYVTTLPELAPGLPESLDSFFMRLVLHEPQIEAQAILTEMTEPVRDGKILPLIFDIDVFNLSSSDANDEDIWLKLEQLRGFKNKIFLDSITEKTKELIR